MIHAFISEIMSAEWIIKMKFNEESLILNIFCHTVDGCSKFM